MERRKFIHNSSLATATGLTILNFPVFGKNAPSNKVVIAIMGLNGRGSYHAEKFSGIPGVEVAYLCDVEEGAIKKGLKSVNKSAKVPTIEKDIRKLVTKTDFDALIVAAPDHWHAPAALLGVSNGKHVYVEKPCSHNPHESEILIQAQSKYGKIIQVGSQRRSFPTLIEAVKQVRAGLIGNPYMAKGWYTNSRKAIGFGKNIPVPSTLDFDLWQGPAQGNGRGFIIYGDKGTLVNYGGEAYKVYDTSNKLVKEIKSENKIDPNNTVSASGDADLYHLNNFVEGIRGDIRITAPIEEGHKSVVLCHLANIAQRTGSALHTDPKNGYILGNKVAEELWKRSYEKGWEMNL